MIRIHYDRPGQRIDGSMVVFLFIMALFIIPLMFVSVHLLPNTTIQVIVWCIVTLAGFSWTDRIYRRRGKSVLKHYAKRSFYPITGFLFFLIPIAIIMAMMCYFAPKS